MNITRRAFTTSLSALLCVAMVLPLAGCPGQSETSALITIVGQSVATLATIQGNPALAKQLTDASTAASTAVTNWKEGTPSTEVTQALNFLLTNIALIPGSDQTKIYIELAVTTINSIIAIVSPAPAGMTASRHATHPIVSAKEYRRQWNSLKAVHPSTVPAI